MTQKLSVSQNKTHTGLVVAYEGEEVAYVIPVSGVTTGISSPTMAFYKRGQQTDVSSTYWTGSMSIEDPNTIVTKSTTGLKAGDWVISIKATVDGQAQIVATIPYLVKRRGDV